MLPIIILMLQSTTLPTITELKFEECITLANEDPPGAILQGTEWLQEGGGYLAQQCVATAHAADFEFPEAVRGFTASAREAEAAQDKRAAQFWAQAGNAAIVAEMHEDALTALDAALRLGTLSEVESGEVFIDRARALVAAGRTDEAVNNLEKARSLAPESAIGWLLSATLARRLGALDDAQNYIVTAALLSPTEPAIALEAGNIAATAGNYAMAQKQWEQVLTIAPKSRQAATARSQLSALAASCPDGTCEGIEPAAE